MVLVAIGYRCDWVPMIDRGFRSGLRHWLPLWGHTPLVTALVTLITSSATKRRKKGRRRKRRRIVSLWPQLVISFFSCGRFFVVLPPPPPPPSSSVACYWWCWWHSSFQCLVNVVTFFSPRLLPLVVLTKPTPKSTSESQTTCYPSHSVASDSIQ